MKNPTPAKLGLRERLKQTQALLDTAIGNLNHGTFVANAMFWKLNLQNRNEIKAVVDEYMAKMQVDIEANKKARSNTVIENFIDPELLKKVSEHEDDDGICSDSFDEDETEEVEEIK